MRQQRAYGQTVNFWLDKGYTEEESELLLKERQATFSLAKCIEKHGKELGTQIWENRQEKWQNTLKSKSKEEIDDINMRKGNGYNNFNHSLGIPGKLYYIHFYDNDFEFWKIGITKKELYERFRFKNIDLKYNILFEKTYDDICDAYVIEQNILKYFNSKRISVDYNGLTSTECFNENVLKEFYEI